MTSRQLLRAVVLLAVVLTIFPLAAQAADVPNADFTAGDDKPDGWTLTGGQGRWVDRQVLEVTGTGDDSNAWHSAPCEFTPGDLYHFRVRTRRLGGGGCVITGPSFANRDQHGVSSDWKWFGHVFRVPDNARDAVLRLGQWEATGSVQFDRVQLTRVLPVHRAAENLVLGQDESIRDGQYAFVGTFGHQGSNFHRTLQSTTTSFNSDRWCFGGSSQVTYRFAVPGHRLQAGRIALAVNYHTRGGCTAEISRDGKQWHALLTQSEMGDAAAELPDALLPAESLLLRLRGVTADSSFQVNRVEFHADLDGSPPELTGDTAYAEVRRTEPGLVVRQMTLTDHGSTGRSALLMQLTNRGSKPLATELAATIDPTGGNSQALRRQEVNLQPGSSTVVPVDLPAQAPGDHEVLLDVGGTQLVLAFSVPEFYRADYGQRIESIAGETAVWWCEATRKIPRRRAVPDDTSPAAQLSAARGDFEAVQVVVRPSKPLVGFTAKVSPLVGPNGATIAAENVDVLRVYYHFVHHPTDATGVRDWWPDALPPLDEPLDVPAGQNQPLWVLVHVPRDAAPGDYTATVQLAAEGWAAAVPVRLHVWNFALPVTNHLETAFGLSAGNVFRYHGLKTEADKRRVFDMYLKCFAEHRISPYDPVPLDPIGVKFVPEADPPRADVDFSAFDREMARVVDKHHFTGYRLPIQGMGGGTFHARSDPRIGDFTEETPEYQA
ncbi:MAG: hypothetical protein HQ581_12555, partial [Planctomycetes bacterium]|nr:hypothetical protein [Planctomycetota bacterium]